VWPLQNKHAKKQCGEGALPVTSQLNPADSELGIEPAGPGSRLRTLQAIVFVLVLGGILTAGLWPFHSPKNDVKWLRSGSGLSFGTYGTILSSGVFDMANVGDRAPCTLEMWVESYLPWDTSTLLAFYDPRTHKQFSLHQHLTNLELRSSRRATRDKTNRVGVEHLYVDSVFHQGKLVFITVTSDGNQTRVYINGALAVEAAQFPFSAEDLAGELVIANSPVHNDSWEGRFRGLAIYEQEFTPTQVLENYQAWTRNGQPAITADERTTALYLFDEREGNIIHNRVKFGVDLRIPERYTVFDEKFLEPLWDEYFPNWSYLKDVLINIVGFIPLGFVANGFFSSVGKVRRAVLFTILLGCATTLTIEILQAFLPTRDSGTTDLITNTLGTYLGVAVYRWRAIRSLYFAILNGLSFARSA
jgi:VanZ family protein